MCLLDRRMLSSSSNVQVFPEYEDNSRDLRHLAGGQEALGQAPHTLSL